MAKQEITKAIREYAKQYGNRGVHELFMAALSTCIGRNNDGEHRGRASLEEQGFIAVRETMFHGMRQAGIMDEEGSRGYDVSVLKVSDLKHVQKMCLGAQNAPVSNLVDVTEAFAAVYGKVNAKTAKLYTSCVSTLQNIDENLFERRVTLKFKPSVKAQELKLATYDRDFAR